jgi:hypothetical protein
MLTDMPFSVARDVISIRYRLHPLDVGFDLRSAGVAVEIGEEPVLRVSYPSAKGERYVVEGPREEVLARLRKFGFAFTSRPSAPGEPEALTIADPNDNSGSRYQYLFRSGLLLRRRLPAAEAGDEWADDPGDPWWEPVLELPPGGPIREYAERCIEAEFHRGAPGVASGYSFQARCAAAHVVAYTPNGREVRWARGGGVELQPPNDNYWLRAPDLREARRLWYSYAKK